MSGHSKWATTKHKKARIDAARGKIFTKMSKEIMVAAKMGGDNPENNFRLRIAIDKAKGNNMPNDNIKRAIQKGAGTMDGVVYEELVYEGYGPAGVAIIMEIMTDNRNRTAGDIRHILDKNGGNLGETGCVSWMFERQGYITVEKEKMDMDEDEFMMLALELGASDVKSDEENYEVFTDFEEFEEVCNAFTGAEIPMSESQLARIPDNIINIETLEDAKKIAKVMEALEDYDDIQDVYSNFEIKPEILEQL